MEQHESRLGCRFPLLVVMYFIEYDLYGITTRYYYTLYAYQPVYILQHTQWGLHNMLFGACMVVVNLCVLVLDE